MSIVEAFRLIKRGMLGLGKAAVEAQAVIDETWEEYKRLYLESYKPIPRIIKAEWQYAPDFNNSLLFRHDMTEDERREHALKCRKNRNTGPTTEWGFRRDGRRV